MPTSDRISMPRVERGNVVKIEGARMNGVLIARHVTVKARSLDEESEREAHRYDEQQHADNQRAERDRKKRQRTERRQPVAPQPDDNWTDDKRSAPDAIRIVGKVVSKERLRLTVRDRHTDYQVQGVRDETLQTGDYVRVLGTVRGDAVQAQQIETLEGREITIRGVIAESGDGPFLLADSGDNDDHTYRVFSPQAADFAVGDQVTIRARFSGLDLIAGRVERN